MLILLFVLLAGCTPTVVLQVGGDVSPARRQWEVDTSATVNDHTRRLETLEAQHKETTHGLDPVPADPRDAAPAP